MPQPVPGAEDALLRRPPLQRDQWTRSRRRRTAAFPAAEALSDSQDVGHRARPDEFVVDIGDRARRARRRAPADRQRPASSSQFVRARRRDSGRRDADARESDHRVLGSYRTAGTRRLTEGSGEGRSAVARPVRSPARSRSDPYQCRPGRGVVRELDRDHGAAGRIDADGPAPGAKLAAGLPSPAAHG